MNSKILFSFSLVVGCAISSVSAVPRYTASMPQVGDTGVIQREVRQQQKKTLRETSLSSVNNAPKSSAGVLDSYANLALSPPATYAEALTDRGWSPLAEEDSIWHNLKEGLLSESSSQTDIATVMAEAWAEYKFVTDRSKWRCLDPKMPNVKFVSEDGHSETVYNKRTGARVAFGINQGTANQSKDQKISNHVHWRDAIRYSQYAAPSSTDRKVAEFMLEHSEFADDFIKRAKAASDDPVLNGIEKLKGIHSTKVLGRAFLAAVVKHLPDILGRALFPLAGEPDELRKLEEIKVTQQKMKPTDVAQREDSNALQPNLHSLNLDDPNGDWCKCEERGEKPGCDANMEASEKGYVIFGCTKCKKVNVKYAKMALALEQQMKGAGVKVMWHGSNAKANARKAASESNK